MPCKNDEGRVCGAGWRNTVFNVEESRKAHTSLIGESYAGCYKDANDRDLPQYFAKAHGDYHKCFHAAAAGHFKYAALQATGYCFAGNSVGKHGKVGDEECNMPCKGHPTKVCGAGWRNSVFVLDNINWADIDLDINTDFSMNERTVILLYLRYKWMLILTETQF